MFKGAEQYDSLTHVPFIWADPKGPDGVRSSDLAQTLDIGSTILEHARIEAAIGMQGQVMSVAGGAGRARRISSMKPNGTQEAFGERPRVHSIVHMVNGGCRSISANVRMNYLISKMIRAR